MTNDNEYIDGETLLLPLVESNFPDTHQNYPPQIQDQLYSNLGSYLPPQVIVIILVFIISLYLFTAPLYDTVHIYKYSEA